MLSHSLSYSLRHVQHLIAAQYWSGTQQNRAVLPVTWWWCYLSLLQFVACTTFDCSTVLKLHTAEQRSFASHMVMMLSLSLTVWGMYNIWSQHSSEVPCCRTEEFCQSHGDDVISLSYSSRHVQHLIAAQCWSPMLQNRAVLPVIWWWCYLSLSYSLRPLQYLIAAHCWSPMLKSHAAKQSSFASHMVMGLSLSLSYSLRHAQYLITAQCWSRTQQNRAVLPVTWWWCYLSLSFSLRLVQLSIAAQCWSQTLLNRAVLPVTWWCCYLSLFQFEACTTFDRSTVLKSHAAEQSSFASHMVMMLNLLQSVMRQYERYTDFYYIT